MCHSEYEPPCLSVKIESKFFVLNGEVREVLRELRFEVPKGEFVTMLGPSGCGKTTLLRLIMGLDLNYDGEIRVSGHPVIGPGRERDIVFQESRLLPWRSILGNVTFALPRSMSSVEKNRRVDHVLGLVGLSDVRHARPSQLSGGMQRRAAFGRAIVNLPELLLMDEPFSGLDLSTKLPLQDQIRGIQQREGMTMLLVTHDIDEAIFFSDRIAILTSRPATINREVTVPLGHPRRRSSPEYIDFKSLISGSVLNHRGMP